MAITACELYGSSLDGEPSVHYAHCLTVIRLQNNPQHQANLLKVAMPGSLFLNKLPCKVMTMMMMMVVVMIMTIMIIVHIYQVLSLCQVPY